MFGRGVRIGNDKPGTALAIFRDRAEICGGSVALGENGGPGGLRARLTLSGA